MEKHNARYSQRAWSAVIPWEWMKPGLSLKLDDAQNREGKLTDETIDWAPPAELVINNIRLGLLTEPPRSTDHYMFLEPAEAGTDYFQTIPIARMVVAKYDEIAFDSVMVADGPFIKKPAMTKAGSIVEICVRMWQNQPLALVLTLPIGESQVQAWPARSSPSLRKQS